MNKKTFLNFLIVATLTLMVLPTSALCELKNLDDDGLSAVYAEGFSDFTITDLGVVGDNKDIQTKALFNIRATTYTTVDSLKLGYHNEYNYKDPTPVYAWDEDWVDVTIGTALNTPTSDFLVDKFYFKAVFDDIDDPANRKLKSFAFGAEYVKGDISAVFNSFSGTIDDSNDGTPEYNGHALNLGPVTITADPNNTGSGGFDISLSIDTYDKGYWVTIPNAIVTP